MNILITGVHGFVGSNLVKELSGQHQIYGLDIIRPEKEGIKKTFLWDEINKLPEIDVIIHLAAIVHDFNRKTDRNDVFAVNVGLTKRIFDHFLNSNAHKFIFFSSVAICGNNVGNSILTESSVPDPKGLYGESKIMAEEYILSHINDIPEKNVIILRPSMIYGEGNKGNLNLLYNIVSRGFPWPLGAFDNKRSFTSVENLKYIISRIISTDIPNGIYNVSDDDPLSTNRIVSLIYRELGLPERIWKLPKWLMKVLAKAGDILNMPLNSERLTKLTGNFVVSNKKLKKALGFEKMPISSIDGMTKTIKYFSYL